MTSDYVPCLAANLQGIRAAQEAFHGKPSVAVFDTAFHQTMPPRAYHYALPRELYEQHQLRRYGAHGTSVRHLVKQAAAMLGKPEESTNLIVAHIGRPQPLFMIHLEGMLAELAPNFATSGMLGDCLCLLSLLFAVLHASPRGRHVINAVHCLEAFTSPSVREGILVWCRSRC